MKIKNIIIVIMIATLPWLNDSHSNLTFLDNPKSILLTILPYSWELKSRAYIFMCRDVAQQPQHLADALYLFVVIHMIFIISLYIKLNLF